MKPTEWLGLSENTVHRLTVGHVGETFCHVWGKGDERRDKLRLSLLSDGVEAASGSLDLEAENGYVGSLRLDGLEADRVYRLEAGFSGTGSELVCRGEVSTTPRQPATVKLLIGSCHFHGWAPGLRDDKQAVRTFRELAEKVNLVLHLGDQVYADKPFPSISDADFRKAYDRAWANESYRWILSHKPNYMIGSDHEAINDCSVDAHLNTQQKVLLALRGQPSVKMSDIVSAGRRVFRDYQRLHAPCRFGPEVGYDTFQVGELRFFATDQRFERDYGARRMMSEVQLEHLLDFLSREREKVCIVLGESPFLHPRIDTQQSWAAEAFKGQRHQILEHICHNRCERVLFLSGDVHASYHATMELNSADGEKVVAQELVSSPINATLMKTRERFESSLSGETSGGVSYKSHLNDESFLGAKSKYDTMNSNATILTIGSDRVTYETHRTRKKDLFPVCRGSFRI